MKIFSLFTTTLLTLTGISSYNLQAGEPIEWSGKEVQTQDALWDCHRVDSHAPIGVMGDHTHTAGEVMVSYRYMFMDMEGMRDGTTDLSSQQLFGRGFPVAPTSMTMDMHMLGFMFAPTDEVTLFAMSNYVFKDMDHVTATGSPPRAAMGPQFLLGSQGWGDTSFGALVKIHDANRRRVHLNLGLSAPTGNLTTLAYPMHTGTGTWDLLPGITYLWQDGALSGGAQLMGRVHLDDNDLGFSYGNSAETTGWLAYMLNDRFSISGRLTLKHAGDVDGRDIRLPGPVFMAPPMDAANHGGTWADFGIGANFHAKNGHRLAIEAVIPFYQDLNGPQMQRDWMLTVGWQKAF